MKTTLLIAALIGLANPALAEDQAVPLTYEIFENAVPHLDLENCPAQLAGADTFCRATLHHEELHVFAFSYEGENPMTGFQTFPAEGLETLLK
ncbi:hypothetical protein N6L24_03335 [Cognatishimia sp. SS12]|uniref:hypothetical protein n=1 Tax=Cognatishimia sp. SS12 TaxID=2979465 RepID=UPI00232AC27A|nr:hypothetical protein [Cognatishimia sp. SS12]MDC0737298.1 hypothetical protein [Cognatishimia sp. SS12]